MVNGMEMSSEKLLVPDEIWEDILEPDLCQNAAAVDYLAHVLFTLKEAIDSGAEGVIQASQTLSRGIELLYPHTNAHKAALELYVLSLEGDLNPQDEPLILINAAIKRGRG
ncbi:MAG TPA: hypothetical protein VJT82_05055 [Pyrinomonadaceae bacterium]|nr:hypothetical protein [Pyrinomonadaceae bacterium]